MRVIGISKRPVIVFAILVSAMSLFLITCGYVSGNLFETLKGLACFLLLLGAVVSSIAGSQIKVTDDGLIIKEGVFSKTEISFEDFHLSRSIALAEKEHPVFLNLIKLEIVGLKDEPENLTEFNAKERIIKSIRLKLFSQEDVSWILSNPLIKVVHDEKSTNHIKETFLNKVVLGKTSTPI